MNKRIASLGCTLLAAILTGCGSSSNVAPPPKHIVPKFVYIANYGSASVSSFSVTASTGTLAPIPGSPFPTGSMPFALVLDASAKFLYVIQDQNPRQEWQ
jgi:DNA-binding beta-propeller fold protein YncE